MKSPNVMYIGWVTCSYVFKFYFLFNRVYIFLRIYNIEWYNYNTIYISSMTLCLADYQLFEDIFAYFLERNVLK